MNYHTDIVNFWGRLLGRGVYYRAVLILKILLFGGALIREWALIRSFMVVQNNKSVYDII